MGGIDFYKDYLKLVPQISDMLSTAEVTSELKQASDWSYSASAYAGPNFRLVGDAGCFVDPYFSSGVHLAFNSGLAAATTIQAARRGQTDELRAAKWHSTKVAEGYTRFLLLVMTVLRQVRQRDVDVISTKEEQGFDRAFKMIQPVIQGMADTRSHDANIQKKTAEGVNFGLETFKITPEKRRAVMDKIERAQDSPETLDTLTPEEVHILDNIVVRTFHKDRDELNLKTFASEVVDGFSANLVRGKLGFVDRSTEVSETSTAVPATLAVVVNGDGIDHGLEKAAIEQAA